MPVYKLIDSARLDSSLNSIANAIRAKGETSEQLIFPDGFVSAIMAIPQGGVENAIAGTFVSDDHSRSITLPDCIGKTSIFIYPAFDLISTDVPVRAHWGSLILNGRTIMQGSTNTAKTAYVFTSIVASESGHVSNADIYNSATGTVTIVAAIDGNYGGVFVAGKTYGYLAW